MLNVRCTSAEAPSRTECPQGATVEMVVKAMLQRPKKSGNPSRKDDAGGEVE